MRVRIIASLGALVGTLILIVATLSVNGTTLQSFQTFDYLAIFFGFLLAVLSLVAWRWWTKESRSPTPHGTEAASTPSSAAGGQQIGPQN